MRQLCFVAGTVLMPGTVLCYLLLSVGGWLVMGIAGLACVACYDTCCCTLKVPACERPQLMHGLFSRHMQCCMLVLLLLM
jgi:hypothetical protein